MSRYCGEVIGIDFSHAFIAAANELRTLGHISYTRRDEARLETSLVAKMPADIDPNRTRFMQGDAMNLSQDLGNFDRVHAANLLCRLTDPAKLLSRLPSLVRPGGELVIATPCTWLEDFTPSANWPPGETLPWLKEHLTESFDFINQADEPFLIRETSRKFQWTRSMVSTWKRRVG
jgi:SAM-dependent methyltransferase